MGVSVCLESGYWNTVSCGLACLRLFLFYFLFCNSPEALRCDDVVSVLPLLLRLLLLLLPFLLLTLCIPSVLLLLLLLSVTVVGRKASSEEELYTWTVPLRVPVGSHNLVSTGAARSACRVEVVKMCNRWVG